MSEETHEDKKAVEIESPSKPRRRRRNRKTGDGSSKAVAQQSSDASESTKAATPVASSATSASGGEQEGADAPKPKSRRRRRKSRSKRQGSGEAVKDGSAQQEAKKRGAGQQGDSRRSQSKSDKSEQNRPKQSRSRQRSKSQSRANVYKPRTPESKFGGREPLITPDFEEERSNEPLELTPFELFCTYHLGISDDNRYRPTNVREVARRFAISQGELEQALKRFGLDRDSVRKIGYDMSLAQLDMQVAPEGIDKRELAKVLFSELVEISPEIAKSVAEATQAVSQVSEEQRAED